MSGAMSAFGTKRTWRFALHMSAFGSKADITKTCGMAALLLGGGFRFRFQLGQLAAQL
jgi:hypothetical protein